MADTTAPGIVPVSDVTPAKAAPATTSPAQTATPPVAETPVPPVTPPATPVTVVSPPVTPADTITQSGPVVTDETLGYLKDYIRRYLEVNNGLLRNDEQRKQAIAILADIMRYVLRNPTPAILTHLFEFFKDHRTVILAPHVSLQGLGHVSDALMKKVAVLHTLFHELTSAAPGNLNLTYASEVLDNQQLTAWVATKLKTLTKAK